jgi:hypothetical protein
MKKVGPVSERDALLIAARRRGLTMPEIGAEFGITTQRVQQILSRHGESGERVERRRVLTSATCAACGKEFGVKPADLRMRLKRSPTGRVYCGQRCALSGRAQLISSTGSQRKLKGADVLRAIELRTGGMTWKAVGQLFAAGPQAVQRAIWVHLAETGRLTETVVLTMWPPHRDRRGFGMMEWRTRLKVTTETGQGAAVRSEARVATLLAPERRPGAA